MEAAKIAAAPACPVIDLAPFLRFASPGAETAPEDPELLARRAEAGAIAREASRRVGAFYVKNHGLPRPVLDRAFAAARRFFALPPAEKARIAAAPPNVRGYLPLPDREGDYKEWYFCTTGLGDGPPGTVNPMPGENLWPREPADFQEAMGDYMRAVLDVGQAIMALLATSLGVAPRAFHDFYTAGGGGGLRALRYPPAAQAPKGRYGANEHSDFPPMAIIAQDDAGGLETQARTKEWVPITPIPETLVCQLGDTFERWTNDEYLAGKHHVVHAPRERHSLAFFMLPKASALIECLETCAGPERPRRYPAITYGQLMADWIAAQTV